MGDLLSQMSDDNNLMVYETKAMLASHNKDFTRAINYQQKALSFSKKRNAKELILTRLELYKTRQDNMVIWYPNETMFYE